MIVTLAILTAGGTFSASGAVRSIGKIFYKNYTTAIEDYRNNSMFVCKAKLRYFDHVSRSIVSDEYPVLNLFQDEIILMDNSRDDPRLVIPRDDIQEIEVVATQTHLRTNSISGLDPKLLHEVPPGAFVSGSITVHNFNPGIVPNRFVKVSQGVNTVILSYSSALASELSRIAALDWTVQYELERMKKSLPEYRKAVLGARGHALLKRINALNSQGFYDHYGEIVRLEDEAKSIQARIDALNLKLDIGYEKTRQTIENIERGYSVDIDLVWLKIEISIFLYHYLN